MIRLLAILFLTSCSSIVPPQHCEQYRCVNKTCGCESYGPAEIWEDE